MAINKLGVMKSTIIFKINNKKVIGDLSKTEKLMLLLKLMKYYYKRIKISKENAGEFKLEKKKICLKLPFTLF